MGAEPQDSAGYYGNHQLSKPEWEVCQEPQNIETERGPEQSDVKGSIPDPLWV